MNPLTQIKNTQKITKAEIELGLTDKASWHDRFKHSAYVFSGGLPFELTEGDLLAVFAQYGEVVDVHLVRDKKTGAALRKGGAPPPQTLPPAARHPAVQFLVIWPTSPPRPPALRPQASRAALPSWRTRTSAARCWLWTTWAGRGWRGASSAWSMWTTTGASGQR